MNTQDTYLNLAEMTNVIRTFLEKNGLSYKTINSCVDINILYNLIKNEDRSRLHKLSTNIRYIAGLYFELIHDINSMMEQYMIGIESGCSECINLMGRYYSQMMKLREMAINKKNIDAIFNLSKYFSDQNQFDKMIHALNMAIELGSEKAIKDLGLYYYRNDQIDKMIETYRSGAHKGFTSCMVELGDHYFKNGDKENTIKYYTAAAKTNPEGMFKLGWFYESNKDYPKMLEMYNRALQHNHTGAMVRLGDYYKKIKNYDLMLYTYKLAAETNPEAMNKIGLYYQKKKKYSEMIKYYEHAIKLESLNAMNNLALYYESIGEYDKMKELLMRAISKKSSIAMYNMGLFHEKMAEYFMMAYQNGRVFDHSEIKLMKKSIVKVNTPKLFHSLSKMIQEKKKQFKTLFDTKKVKVKKEKKLQKEKSQYKFSTDYSEPPKSKTGNLIDIPVEEKSTNSISEIGKVNIFTGLKSFFNSSRL